MDLVCNVKCTLTGTWFLSIFSLTRRVRIQAATLRQDLKMLVTKRNQLEDAYTVCATEEFGMDHENAVANIKKARSAPQKNKRLQAIHEAHGALLSKQAKIDEFESNLVVMREARPGRKVTMTLQ